MGEAPMGNLQSEFYTLSLTTKATPIELGGACEVIFLARGDDIRVTNRNDATADDYFLIPNAYDGASSIWALPPMSVRTSDERLYVNAASSSGLLYIWVIRESGY